MERQQLSELIEQFLAASRRERHVLLKTISPHLEREDIIRIARVIRDPSPKTAARVTALLARHQLGEVFESHLAGLARGKIDLLRAHFRRFASRDGGGGSATAVT